MKKYFWKLRTIVVIITIGSLLIGMGGCSSMTGKSAKAANLMEGVTAQNVTVEKSANEYSKELNEFGVKLFNACYAASSNSNTLISPLSVLLALSMTANGAKAETLAQMEEVLGLSADELNKFASAYMKALSGRPESKGSLELANSIWFNSAPRLHVEENFLQTNANYFNAELYSAPFDESTLKEINNWVNDKTKGMIPSILDYIPQEAVMYLVNALAFDAEWLETYTEEQVGNYTFTTAEGTQKSVPFLHGTEGHYIEDENAKGFIKYYKGAKYAFAAILPNEGMTPEEYMKTVSGEHLSEMISNVEFCEVLTKLPKFKTEYSVEMSGVLKNMGMPVAFNPDLADFTGLGTSDEGNIFISRVLHKTFIEVDEKGTKAGAATVVEMADNGAGIIDEPKEVYLTRPFVYMLVDCEANIPFFIGVMNDPEK